DRKHAGYAIRPCAAEQRMNTRHELGNGKGFDHVIVGSDKKAAHPLALLAARREHDYRQASGGGAGANAPAYLKTRDARKHPIEDDKVRDHFSEPDFRFIATLDALHGEAFRLEIVREEQAERSFVLDDENARGGLRRR